MVAAPNPGPPPHVLEAFSADGPPQIQAGGVGGRTYRAGSVVLKPAANVEEAEWGSGVLERLEGPGFRVPRPIRAKTGGWVLDGWQASRFVDGQHAGRNGGRWDETIAACRAFHAALAGAPKPAFLDARDDAWAQADRLAFGELTAEPMPYFAAAIERLTRLARPVSGRDQVIHGDFTANVLFAEGEPPCVIDFTPYWRPPGFALAVVVSDALSWTGAGAEIVELCADIPDFEQWLLRATLRRVWELDQHSRRGWANREEHLAEYLATIALIERLTAES